MTTTDLNTNNQQPPQGGQMPPQQGDPTTTQQQGQGQTPNTSQQTPQGQSPLTAHWTDEDREYFKKIRDENKNLRESLDAFKKQQADAEQERMKKSGEFENLAKQHEARVKELEPKAAELAEITAMITQQIEAETKDWPASVKAMAPGPKASLAERLAWRTKGQVIIAELANTQRAQAPGNGQNPPAVGGNQQSQAGVDQLYTRLQTQRGNPF